CVQPAQLPAQAGATASWRNAKRALCHEPAASVPSAPATHTTSTTRAVSGTAARATAPPAPSITAAANWVGAMARSASAVAPKFRLCASDQVPNPAEATAAHMHSTPAISMASQYEPDYRPAHPPLRAWAPPGLSAGGTKSSAAGAGPAPWPAGWECAADWAGVSVRGGEPGPWALSGRAAPTGRWRGPGLPGLPGRPRVAGRAGRPETPRALGPAPERPRWGR